MMNENPSQGTVTCLNCGLQAPAIARFCPRCANAMSKAQTPAWTSPEGATPAPAAPTDNGTHNAEI